MREFMDLKTTMDRLDIRIYQMQSQMQSETEPGHHSGEENLTQGGAGININNNPNGQPNIENERNPKMNKTRYRPKYS